MRLFCAALGFLVCGALLAGQDPAPAGPDYRELSRLLQQAVVKQLPPEVEKRTGWGETIPVPPDLPLPRLRKYVKVGDHFEVPHGAWRRVKAKIEDPKRDLQLQVREFRQLDPSTYRLALDVDALVACEGEWQQWQTGLRLLAATAVADAAVRLSLVCDIAVSVEFKKFPPEVKLEPKVQDLKVDLKSLNVRHLGNRLVQGEKIEGVNENLEELLREGLKQSEPLLKAYANDAIARGLREGKGSISPAELFKAVPGKPDGKPEKK